MSKNTFYISCPIDCYAGYGSRSRDVVKALIQMDKYDVKIIPQRWGATPQGFIDDHREEWGFLKEHIHQGQLTEQPDYFMQITVPNEAQPVGKFNIILTAGIETTACAPQWIEGCNRMDLVLVSSEHSKKVFEDTKYNKQDKQGNVIGTLQLEKPIRVLMEGVDLDTYKVLENKSEFENTELYESLESIPESFAYLYLGHWMQGDMGEDRKNVGLLIKAFYETFKNKSKQPALILKTSGAGSSYMDRREIQRKIDSIKRSCPSSKLPKVYLLHGDFTDREINEIYNHPKVKAMVSLTKGEGYGRPLLEFSLVNKPIITTGWSGHMDFLSPNFTTLLRGELKNIHPSAQVKDILIEGSQWFSPDLNHVGHSLIEVKEKYKDYKIKGKRQGYHSRSKFSFDNMVEQLEGIINNDFTEVAKQVELKLPKLKKLDLPKLKKLETNE